MDKTTQTKGDAMDTAAIDLTIYPGLLEGYVQIEQEIEITFTADLSLAQVQAEINSEAIGHKGAQPMSEMIIQNLTPKEIAVIKRIRHNEYAAGRRDVNYEIWTDCIAQVDEMNAHAVAGVLSSLHEKGIVESFNIAEGDSDGVTLFSEAGLIVSDAIEQSSTKNTEPDGFTEDGMEIAKKIDKALEAEGVE